ncbi:hypothetical protein HYY72_04615 [Candidatus Woesearchaeota archaeon]|nr:hypothetical protein [Candidatus Woesearchaeota archaeon]
MERIKIQQPTSNETTNIALDTISSGKQALIFLGTKPSAEKAAEEISKKARAGSPELEKLSLELLHSLSRPTKQCERLAYCIKKGIAFHHSGLTHEQRTAIENSFRSGLIRIICCTPTLASGLDLPAYRAIIRDLKRYGRTGMNWIPVLEYLQMSGRAGRPKFDTEGQAIAVASTEPEKKQIYERYVLGQPEDIYSKLAVEPALRTYILSLISTRFVTTMTEINEFFSRTFWAHQYKDTAKLKQILLKMLGLLAEWGFINEKEEFTSASELDNENRIVPTITGRRVAELYLDPLTAHHIITCMQKAGKATEAFPYLIMISSCLEMRPLLRVAARDYEAVQETLLHAEGKLLQEEPSMYEEEHEEFINAVKTAMFLNEWMDEKDEEYLLQKYNVRPGEIHAKLNIADWLVYSSMELGRLLQLTSQSRELGRIRVRIKHGVKEELLPLLKLKGIGRVRARKLFNSGITDIGAVKKADTAALAIIIGPAIAADIKGQVGQEDKTEQLKLDNGTIISDKNKQ